MKWFYELGYRYFRMPWDVGPRKELTELVESGRIPPGRAIDLGSGTASNCIFLAQRGFQVTGVDFAASAVELGRRRAAEAGVNVEFIHDDLTDLRHVSGVFDLLVDYGTLDDLNMAQRDEYMRHVLPLTHAQSVFLLFCFEWEARWWEQVLAKTLGAWMLAPGEAERRFGPHFHMERYAAAETDFKQWPAGWAVYLMQRKAETA